MILIMDNYLAYLMYLKNKLEMKKKIVKIIQYCFIIFIYYFSL